MQSNCNRIHHSTVVRYRGPVIGMSRWFESAVHARLTGSLLLGLFASLAAALFGKHRRWLRGGEIALSALAMVAVMAIVFIWRLGW